MKLAWLILPVFLAAIAPTLMAPQAFAKGQGPDVVAQKPGYISGRSYTLNGYPMYGKGQPFSLVEKRTTIVAQPEGTNRTNESIHHVFRDSEGRFRIEDGVVKDGKFVLRWVMIFDPVALTQINYMGQARTGRLTHVEPRSFPTQEEEQKAAEQRARSEAYDREHPEAGGTERLGTLALVGEDTEGVRVTATFNAVDGGPPKRLVREIWTAPGLSIPLLTKEDGPVPGRKTIIEVTELKRGEPDASLFKVPEGMELVEETRPQ